MTGSAAGASATARKNWRRGTRRCFSHARAGRGARSTVERTAIMQKARELDPLNASFHFIAAVLLVVGPVQRRGDASEKGLALSPRFTSGSPCLAIVLLAEGKPDAALQEVLQEPENGYRWWALTMVHHALGKAPSPCGRCRGLRAWAISGRAGCPGSGFPRRYGHGLSLAEVARKQHDTGICWTRNHPVLANLHGDPAGPSHTETGLDV